MKEIYVVYTGCYSDIREHGYFTTKEEAKEYCDFMNQVCTDSWDEYRYYELKPINLQEQKSEIVSLFTVETQGWNIIDIEGQMVKDGDVERLHHCCKNYSESSQDEESFCETDFELHLVFIGLNDINHARKAARDLIAMIREKYYECNDWKLTMECFGGEVR